jgi:hypothetical protein
MAKATNRHATPAGVLRRSHDGSADDNECRVEDVDSRHHPGAPLGSRPSLNRGECRHHKQAACDSEPDKIDGHMPAAG